MAINLACRSPAQKTYYFSCLPNRAVPFLGKRPDANIPIGANFPASFCRFPARDDFFNETA
jgi:hypothetical protein